MRKVSLGWKSYALIRQKWLDLFDLKTIADLFEDAFEDLPVIGCGAY